jgi:hypothetical protein
MNVASQWKRGVVFPRWADLAYWGYGEPTFIFYPPVSWTFGGFLGLLLPWLLVPGAFCWVALMLAAIAMYEVAKRWFDPSDAMFAAVFYAVNPYFLLVIYWRSAFAELLAAALLPLLLLFITQLDETGHRTALRLSLVFATAWMINVPASIMIHYSAAGLALVPAVQARSLRPLMKLAVAVLLGAGLASFYLIPAIYEQRWIQIAQVLSPGVRPQDNFLFTMTSDPDHNHFNQLVSFVGVAEMCFLAIAVLWSRRDRVQMALWQRLALWGVGAGFFLFGASWVFWKYLPKFRYVQLPFRWLLCVNAALALLLTMATERDHFPRWLGRSAVILILLAGVFFAGKRTQPPWWDTAADMEEMRQFVFDGSGYEGVDEYLPAGADPDVLNKALPRLSDETGSSLHAAIIDWRPTAKHFRIATNQSMNVTLRLFNYPAWKAAVNGRPVNLGVTDASLIVVPLAAGENDVQIFFTRTIDRTTGAAISLLSIAILTAAWTWTRAKPEMPMR